MHSQNMKVHDSVLTLRESDIQNRTDPGMPFLRRYPIGAEVMPGGGVQFRVWAPKPGAAEVEISSDSSFHTGTTRRFQLAEEGKGYFSAAVPQAAPGSYYRFRLANGSFPDPASRFQPEGPHGPSQVIDPSRFQWTDQAWPGISRHGRVIYEMHIGTFTREGTWRAAMEELPELARLGITVIELMPVAEFAGRFGWGYDGVDLFAPKHEYGAPADFRAFVDRAHHVGVGVILDVVYNHLGPDGNYLKHFSEDYFTDRYQNEWGEAINFDGSNSTPVREFFTTNAAYWIDEFHLDGLRLDATQQIFDVSPNNIMGVIARTVREAGRGRTTYLVGENEPQQVQLVRPFEQHGYGLDALWNDDFHHAAMVAAIGRNEAYYSDYAGSPQEFVSTIKWGYLFQGQWFSWQKQRRGSLTFGMAGDRFVNYIQNHDQVANSLRGLRLHQLTSPGRFRALTALLLLGPATPMLFQGQEFAASSPFYYFADHNPDLAALVAKGRKEFLSQFVTIACPASDAYLSDPANETTFLRSKLDLTEREKHAEVYRLHRDLLRLRREDPVFSRSGAKVDGAVLGPEAFVIRFFGEHGQDRLLLVNLGLDLRLRRLAEPLLAPINAGGWSIQWSSEDPCYGGCGTPPLDTEGNWIVLGQAAVALTSVPPVDADMADNSRTSTIIE